VCDLRQNRSERCSITLKLVRDDPKWCFALVSQQSLKESLGGTLIPTWLNENVNDIAVLIDRTPEVLLLAVDSHEEFVKVPAIAEASLLLLKTSCIVSAELPTPTSNGFIGDCDASFREKVFHIAEAHGETMIDPHGVTDDFRWKTVSVVTGSNVPHRMSLSISRPS
jgi:hypothetical protein